MGKRNLVTIITALLAIFPAGAMDLSRTDDPVYKDLQIWSARGLIRQLPNFRPYPLSLVRDFLRTVAEKGSGDDQERAKSYLSEISESFDFGVRLFHRSLFAVGYPNHDYDGTTGGFLKHNGFLHPDIGFSGFAGAVAVDWADLTAYPLGYRTPFDFLLDDSSIEVVGRNYLLALSMGGSLSFGTPEFYGQIGLNRHGFGPFNESVVFSPSAKEAPSFALTWRPEGFIYSKYFMALNATQDNDARPFTNGQAFYPDKYLAGQSFQFFLWDIFDISLYETVIFGQRLDPYYFVPGMSLLYSSIYNGMRDNILVGANLTVRLPWSIRFISEFHADDLSFLKIFAGEFDGKTKIAAQAGIEWYPDFGVLEGLEVRYALVTPYTFTHVREFITGGAADQSLINYKNYTHSGVGLVNLEPNSDRWEASLRLRPNSQLFAVLTARMLRHGNASEDGYDAASDEFIGTTDGGIFDNGYVSPGGDQKFNTNRFLTQAVIETLFQFEVRYSLLLLTPVGKAEISGGYMFEFGTNRRGGYSSGTTGTASYHNGGVPIVGNDGVRHYVLAAVSFDL